MSRVAVIQNQSEAFELSYGNVIITLKMHFPKYTWDLFATKEGMSQLVENLEDYDAVIFTSNALNDTAVRQFWLDAGRQNVFEAFLGNAKGILILHQLKMIGQQYSFLGEHWTVKNLKRESKISSKPDSPVDGTLSVNTPHLIINYPESIVMAHLAESARTSYLPGLYWYSLEPVHPEHWISVIQDTTYVPPRDLLLISGVQTPSRIVITSLPLDWQHQFAFLTNLLTYVVEGTQSVAVVQRIDQRPYEFEYMLSYLKINKVAYREYWCEKLEDVSLPAGVHSAVVIGPAWAPGDVTTAVVDRLKKLMRSEGKLIFFDTLPNNLPSVTTIGGRTPFTVQYRDSIMWLKSAYDYDLGLWDGSFLRTMHVLEALATFGEPLDAYKLPTLQYAYQHDIDGSHDNTFVPTCELVRLYFLFGETNRFNNTMAWLKKELVARQRPPLDILKAYIVFRQYKLKEDPLAIERIRGIISTLPDSNIDLVRYLQAAIAYDLTEQIQRFAKILMDHQLEDGSWGLDPANRALLTSAIVEILIRARLFLSPTPETTPSIQDVILKGITYLHSFILQRAPDRQQAATVAMALQAIYRFTNDIFLPIEDFAASQRLIQGQTRNIATVDVATNFISNLQRKVSTLTVEKAALEKGYSRLKGDHSRMQYFSLAMLLFLIVSILMVTYATLNVSGFVKELTTVALGILQNWFLPFWWIVTIPLAIWVLITLTRFGLLPRFVLRTVQFISAIFSGDLKGTKSE